jgi:hypothetical protein
MTAKEHPVVLHLSDLHFGWEGDENGRTNRNLALNGLFRLLSKLKKDWRPDCVCISGDVGWAGRADDYKDARRWIEQLLNELNLLPEALLMCPGNHDAKRDVAQRNARPGSAEEADRVLAIPIQEHYEKPFEAFTEFCKEIGTSPYTLGRTKSYLVGVRLFQGVNFVAYNSAWSSQDNYDKEKLWLGLPQIRYLEKESQLPNPEQIAGWSPILAFFHHPYEWFHEDEIHASAKRPNTFDYMARRCHLFFTGHTHGEVRDADQFAGGGWHLSGGATYAGASHFNFFRIVQVKPTRFVYRTFEFDPRSADNVWWEKGKAKSLAFKGLRKKDDRTTSVSPREPKGKKAEASRVEKSSLTQTEPKPKVDVNVEIKQTDSVQQKQFQWDIFISYSRADADAASRIGAALKERDVRVWIDTEQISPGDLFVSKMEDGLEQSSSVAILISPSSTASKWVEEEYSRAISLAKRVVNPVRVIPVLIKEAVVPGFLANRSWVDFQDESQFETNIDLLVKGIRLQSNNTPSLQAVSPTVRPLFAKMSFLWFFPEGMLVGLYRYLIAQMRLEVADARAEQAGLVRIRESEGPTMIGADAERIRELQVLITDPTKTAQQLLANIKRWADESGVFHDMAGFGVGRALLIRDGLSLVQYTADTSDGDSDLKAWFVQTARDYLLRIAEQHLRIAVEISKGLLAMAYARTAADDLVHAHLLLHMGEAGQSADLFEAYRGLDLFDQLELTEIERFNFALDWAKATKDAGRARQMHPELVKSYDSMLQLLRKLKPASDEEKQTLERAEADLLNNWATQVAQFGDDSEWTKAQKSFPRIYDIYQTLRDNDRLIGARANFVAQSLDRFDRRQVKASEKQLRSLLTSLEKLDSVVNKTRAS